VAHADGVVSLARDWPPRFSYDAVRVPLWLAWSGLGQESALLAARRFWVASAYPAVPAWVDLVTDVVAPYAVSPGIGALVRLVVADGAAPVAVATLPTIVANSDYYASALALLASWAWQEASASRNEKIFRDKR